MEEELRLKALERLAQSNTEEADAALQRTVTKVVADLRSETKYHQLKQHLKVLQLIGFRSSECALEGVVGFVRRSNDLQLEYPENWPEDFKQVEDHASLIIEAMSALESLRYFETAGVFSSLLELSQSADQRISEKAESGLRALAEFNMSVFYGPDLKGGIGPRPQMAVLAEIERFDNEALKKYFIPILIISEALLSPEMERTTSTHDTITLTRGGIPGSPEVRALRQRTLTLLRRIYELCDEVERKIRVVSTMQSATRISSRANPPGTLEMIRENVESVLTAFSELVKEAPLPVVQKIEHDGYWQFARWNEPRIRELALRLERDLSQHDEYQIFKTLIGFEGIFGSWAELDVASPKWDATESLRRARAEHYVASINDANADEWRTRILGYATTDSADLATFPIFYHFLEQLARQNPGMAIALLERDAGALANFLIPLLRGLWEGEHKETVRKLLVSWIETSQHLYAAAKLFLSASDIDVDLLVAILEAAKRDEDLNTTSILISVATANYVSGKQDLVPLIFIPAIQHLSEKEDARWIFDFWFRREAKAVIADLSLEHLQVVLDNLTFVKAIDYHAEEILSLIASKDPIKVIYFFGERLAREEKKPSHERQLFDAIPYDFHKLQEPLSKFPREAVQIVREWYDGRFSHFMYRGGRLLSNIFPVFSEDFEQELITLVRDGNELDIQFVLAVLRNYDGQHFLHNVCREAILKLPEDSDWIVEVAIILESTGVVTGEFGFVEAWTSKAKEARQWLNDPSPKVRAFAEKYINNLENMTEHERQRAEEEIKLRKLRYGD